jgi:hypothetical protein
MLHINKDFAAAGEASVVPGGSIQQYLLNSSVAADPILSDGIPFFFIRTRFDPSPPLVLILPKHSQVKRTPLTSLHLTQREEEVVVVVEVEKEEEKKEEEK